MASFRFIAAKAEKLPGKDTGSRLWRQTFGEAKEEPSHRPTSVTPGGTYAKQSIAGAGSVKRLLQALASRAPGGWSDDRWAETRNFIGAVFLAIDRVGTHLRQAEFTVYRKDPAAQDGKRNVDKDDEAYGLVELLEKPNEDDSFGDLMYGMYQQLGLTGTSLTWAVPSVLGKPCRLYVIPTAIAIPQPTINPEYPDGFWRIQPVYPYGPFSSYPTPTSSVGAPIDARQMIRVKYIHPFLRYDGYSPQTGMGLWLDEFNMIDRSRHYSMKGGINPCAVLDMTELDGAQPLPEAEIERLVAQFEQTVQSPENMGKLYVPPPGSKLEAFGNTPDHMMYESGWDQLASVILGGFGITKPAAGMVEDSSYSTLFATLKQLHWITLEPICEMISQKLTRYLAPFWGDDLVIQIRCKPINDHEVNFQKIDKGTSGKCMTKNEARKLMDLPMTEEEWGNDIVGDPSPAEKEQQEQQQAAAAPPGGMPGAPPAPPQLGENVEEAAPEPPEISKSRPKAGKLAEGALGPRKSLNQLRRQYFQRNGVYTNGVH